MGISEDKIDKEQMIEDLCFLSDRGNYKSIKYAVECIEKLDKVKQILADYDGSTVSMIKQFSEIQKIIEQG